MARAATPARPRRHRGAPPRRPRRLAPARGTRTHRGRPRTREYRCRRRRCEAPPAACEASRRDSTRSRHAPRTAQQGPPRQRWQGLQRQQRRRRQQLGSERQLGSGARRRVGGRAAVPPCRRAAGSVDRCGQPSRRRPGRRLLPRARWAPPRLLLASRAHRDGTSRQAGASERVGLFVPRRFVDGILGSRNGAKNECVRFTRNTRRQPRLGAGRLPSTSHPAECPPTN